MDATAPGTPYWQRLLYRWFVEYNPLYLLSAALVLGGITLVTRGLPDNASAFELVGVGAIPELYAAALIGGAALLMRIGLKRPAVLLALITALYQCDLTLHTDTCAYLDWVGVLGTAAWAGFFIAKLYALAWAMKLSLSRSAVLVASLGALGIAVLPHFLAAGHVEQTAPFVVLWPFSMLAAGLWSVRRVDCALALDEWGVTVKERALRAVWILWALLALLHVVFWCDKYGLGTFWLLPMAVLLSTRFVRREARVWALVIGTLALVGWEQPTELWLFALMAAGVLCLRALRQPRQVAHAAPAPIRAGPYRAATAGVAPPPVTRETRFERADRAALLRLATGVLFSVYLAAWTFNWTGGPWPAHLLPLDIVLTFAVFGAVWRARARVALLPLFSTWGHYLHASGMIPTPRTFLGWGVASVGLGFGLLLASLWISYRLGRQAPSTS